MSTRYIPHIIYTIAITSITTHLLNQRKSFEDQRYHIRTHISLLESTVSRLRAGEDVDGDVFERIEKMKREYEVDRSAARGVRVDEKEVIGWREVLLGSRGGSGEGRSESGPSEWEKRDLERVRQEIEKESSSS